MSWAKWLQETRQMRIEEVYEKWSVKRLSQEEGVQLLGVCERTFRRYINRYEEAGLDGLMDKRLTEVSHRQAPVDEVLRLEALYKERNDSWNVQHFDGRYPSTERGQVPNHEIKLELAEDRSIQEYQKFSIRDLILISSDNCI